MASSHTHHHGFNIGRARVRTPGKYIVLFLFVPVILVAFGAGLWLAYEDRRAAYASVEYRRLVSGERRAFYALPEFLVDLSIDADGRTKYLRLTASIQLETENVGAAIAHIDAQKLALVERLTFFLRELRPEDFDETEDMNRLKKEMVRRVNLVLSPYGARDVVIEDMIIQ
ncbi:MAG: flagellar basal body-associated FliL family protein [Pseudomonadota bacterium]